MRRWGVEIVQFCTLASDYTVYKCRCSVVRANTRNAAQDIYKCARKSCGFSVISIHLKTINLGHISASQFCAVENYTLAIRVQWAYINFLHRKSRPFLIKSRILHNNTCKWQTYAHCTTSKLKNCCSWWNYRQMIHKALRKCQLKEEKSVTTYSVWNTLVLKFNVQYNNEHKWF